MLPMPLKLSPQKPAAGLVLKYKQLHQSLISSLSQVAFILG
jgi:hypothetical protein